MKKLILLVRRKPGTTHEAFRAYYESTHAPLATHHLKSRLVRYVRNFLTALPGQPEPEYDCATEFWFADEAALKAVLEWTRSEEGQVLARDEANFMDRTSMRVFVADEAQL